MLLGEVAEWSIALDLKSSEPKGSVGSNPTLSVTKERFVLEMYAPLLGVHKCELPNEAP
jgi:hypothetical protein